VGEEESSEVEELGLVDESLDLRGSEVGRSEGLGGSEGGGEGSNERKPDGTTKRSQRRESVESSKGKERLTGRDR